VKPLFAIFSIIIILTFKEDLRAAKIRKSKKSIDVKRFASDFHYRKILGQIAQKANDKTKIYVHNLLTGAAGML